MEEKKDDIKFALFCVEVAQAGVALTMEELRTVYLAGQKLEGWSDEDFKRQNGGNNAMEDYIKQAKKSTAMINKRRQLVEALTFSLITKDADIESLSKRDDLIEYVGKAKRIGAIMADEFMEPDEKLEKVTEDGRRVIEHFIDQWKRMDFTPSVEEVK